MGNMSEVNIKYPCFWGYKVILEKNESIENITKNVLKTKITK